MDLVTLVVILIFIGVILWAINTLIPMDPKIKQILNVVVVLAVLLWLFYAFVGPHVAVVPAPHAR